MKIAHENLESEQDRIPRTTWGVISGYRVHERQKTRRYRCLHAYLKTSPRVLISLHLQKCTLHAVSSVFCGSKNATYWHRKWTPGACGVWSGRCYRPGRGIYPVLLLHFPLGLAHQSDVVSGAIVTGSGSSQGRDADRL